MKLLIDADALPRAIKPIIERAIERLSLQTIVVSNKKITFNKSKFIEYIIVEDGLDKADDKIVELTQKGDLVITADIPLADRIVKLNAVGLDHRGTIFDETNINHYLSMRNLMTEIRDSGEITKGPKPFGPNDMQKFANSFNKLLTKLN
jgi:uncharacterized protein YaiI (UPF0178 family)